MSVQKPSIPIPFSVDSRPFIQLSSKVFKLSRPSQGIEWLNIICLSLSEGFIVCMRRIITVTVNNVINIPSASGDSEYQSLKLNFLS